MAYAVQRLLQATGVKDLKIFVMTSHEGGIVAFGKNIADAFATLRE